MAKRDWLKTVVERIEGKRVSSICSVLTFCVIALVNWKWFLPFPFYDLEEMAVIGFAATLSWIAFAGSEVAGMIIASLMKEKARAESDARVSAANEEAARERAARIAAESKLAILEARSPNGGENAVSKAVEEAMAILTDERDKDRAVILSNQEILRANQETLRANQETLGEMVRLLTESRAADADRR